MYCECAVSLPPRHKHGPVQGGCGAAGVPACAPRLDQLFRKQSAMSSWLPLPWQPRRARSPCAHAHPGVIQLDDPGTGVGVSLEDSWVQEETDGNKQDAETSTACRAEGLGEQMVQRLSFANQGVLRCRPLQARPHPAWGVPPRAATPSVLQADRHCVPSWWRFAVF